VKPDVVLHCAALASHEECELNPDLAWTINVESTATLAGICAELGSKLIHISTDAVFDGTRGNYSELDEVNPFSIYGETKAHAEVEVAKLNPGALIVRTNFFGWSPSGRSSVLEFFVRGLSQTGDVIGFTDYRVTSIYVDDLIANICDTVRENWDGLLHVASSDAQSKFEFGKLVAAELNLPQSRVVPGKRWAPMSLDLSLDTSALQKRTSMRTPTQQTGIHRALEETSPFIDS
jgi:dTDP-4-dehydrorhamnose reductase